MHSDEYHLYLYGPGRSPLDSSFEEAAERLEKLEKLYFEPDGSFVWSAPSVRSATSVRSAPCVREAPGNPGQTFSPEQIFGMLYDAAGKLQYVELRGNATCGEQGRQMFLTVMEAISPGATDPVSTDPVSTDLSSRALGADLTVVVLPEGSLQDLQSFVSKRWA